MNAPGKGLLKVSGILMIVFAGLGLIGAMIIGGIAAGAGAGALGFVLVVAVLLGIALNLIAGILGIKYCDKPEKAQVCFIMGVVLVALEVISAVSTLFGGTFVWYNVVIGLVLPIIYLLGALKNKEVSGTGVQGGSVIEQAKDALGDARADIASGAIVDEAKGAATDAVAGAKEIGGNVVDAGKEAVEKVTDMVEGKK